MEQNSPGVDPLVGVGVVAATATLLHTRIRIGVAGLLNSLTRNRRNSPPPEGGCMVSMGFLEPSTGRESEPGSSAMRFDSIQFTAGRGEENWWVGLGLGLGGANHSVPHTQHHHHHAHEFTVQESLWKACPRTFLPLRPSPPVRRGTSAAKGLCVERWREGEREICFALLWSECKRPTEAGAYK